MFLVNILSIKKPIMWFPFTLGFFSIQFNIRRSGNAKKHIDRNMSTRSVFFFCFFFMIKENKNLKDRLEICHHRLASTLANLWNIFQRAILCLSYIYRKTPPNLNVRYEKISNKENI